jgi:NAD(P)-dependent dehydrogenase (short-subunit alcohol dehydrogenase family)
MTGRVDGKVAIVTGGAAGIGRAAAELLAAEGASVVVTDIDTREGEIVVKGITANGGTAIFRKQNVVDEPLWNAIVSETVETYGKLDILVNNAGIATGGPITEMTLESWRNLMEVNVDSVFLGTKHSIPAMTASGGGSIINISSVAGIKGAPGLTAYNATKGAVRLFTKGVARECAAGQTGIRVNSVHPGIIDTAIWGKMSATMAESAEGSILDAATDGANAPDVEAIAVGMQVPMGHSGKPAEIAEGILFLASDASSHMTGSELVIDGGLTC